MFHLVRGKQDGLPKLKQMTQLWTVESVEPAEIPISPEVMDGFEASRSEEIFNKTEETDEFQLVFQETNTESS